MNRDKGSAIFDIDVSALDSGAYTIEINRSEGSAKANQPLNIYGNWSVAFLKKQKYKIFWHFFRTFKEKPSSLGTKRTSD